MTWVVSLLILGRFARRRMKLALSRAMLQNADILLMDEPTNHLDVMNVKWVKDYIKSLTNVTCIMVSHDSGLLNDVCNHILEIADLKLACFKGNLAAFVKVRPEARAYFELKSNKLKFHFPKPVLSQREKYFKLTPKPSRRRRDGVARPRDCFETVSRRFHENAGPDRGCEIQGQGPH